MGPARARTGRMSALSARTTTGSCATMLEARAMPRALAAPSSASAAVLSHRCRIPRAAPFSSMRRIAMGALAKRKRVSPCHGVSDDFCIEVVPHPFGCARRRVDALGRLRTPTRPWVLADASSISRECRYYRLDLLGGRSRAVSSPPSASRSPSATALRCSSPVSAKRTIIGQVRVDHQRSAR